MYRAIFLRSFFIRKIIFLILLIAAIDTKGQWFPQSSGISTDLFSTVFIDSDTGTAVGFGGIILRTTNGGESWEAQSSGLTGPFYCVFFTDSNNETVVGYQGIILRTTNGGTTWTTQNSGTNKWLSSVSFSDENFGTAVGWDGTILRTTNGGITFIQEPETRQIKSFYLKNNYPNPFHHFTSIEYVLTHNTQVTIIIFNESGHAIRILVDTFINSGCHSVIWDGTNDQGTKMCAGTYLCTLGANNISQTIKMTLTQ